MIPGVVKNLGKQFIMLSRRGLHTSLPPHMIVRPFYLQLKYCCLLNVMVQMCDTLFKKCHVLRQNRFY